jgi:HEAT repeat protein
MVAVENGLSPNALDISDAECDPETWQEIANLAGKADRESVECLLTVLADKDPAARWQAGVALAQTAEHLRKRAHLGTSRPNSTTPNFAFTELLARMRQNLQAPDPVLRAATADAFALWDHEAAVSFLGQTLSDPEPAVRASVITALGHIGDVATVDWLIAGLADLSMWVRRAAADALGEMGARQAVGDLEHALADDQPLVRASVVAALGHMRSPKARQILERCTQDADLEIRWYAARSLGQIGDRASCAALADMRREQGVTLFGQTTAEVADHAIVAIEKRDRGLVNRVRRVLYTLIRLVRRTRRER